MNRPLHSLCLLTAAVLTLRVSGAIAAPSSGSVDFLKQVKPLLQARCAGCHGAAGTSGLSVLSAADLIRGGSKAGPAVIPGDSGKSPIVQYLRGERSPRMPLGGQAQPELTALLARWIDEGAKVGGQAVRPTPTGPTVSPIAFRKPVHSTPPRVHGAAWVRTPIDAFVLAALERKGMHPAPEASREELIRRVTYDLTGLPPSPEEVAAFAADRRPGAYEALVDRLLASPRYGEHWGRHWLDLARYADSDGYEQDGERPNAWRYRDYVIRAFNEDMPYDTFIREQIAGDELRPGDPEGLIATAFLRNGPWDGLAFDGKARWNDFLTDATDTTGSVFLGLTVGCARCHDHKYDPIPQRDYYRLQSFFAGVKLADLPISPPLPLAPPPPTVMAVTDRGPTAPAHYRLIRGDINRPGEEVTPGFLTALSGGHPDAVISPPPGGKTTGRRSALANWIASAENPQTARVLVNRVWLYHFGRGIVNTPSDFGKNGEPAANPQLLDWIACEFTAPASAKDPWGCGWRLKKLHRLILLSSAYRQSTQFDATYAKRDPENRLIWHMNRQRLEGEEIRDAILSVSGRLNLKMGGPGVYPEVEQGVLDTGSTHKWGSSPEEEQQRRTVYVFQRRSVVLPIVEAFDGADMSGTCPRRAVTTIAPQALVLLNSDFARKESGYLAQRVEREAGPVASAEVDRLFRLALSRAPTALERKQCLEFLRRQGTIHSRETRGGAVTGAAVVSKAVDAPAERALQDLCHVVLNTNEFVYLE